MASLLIIIIVLCLALSFLLSGMESGVFALSRLRIRRLMRQGNQRARTLYRYLDEPEDFLWTILVGNVAANFISATVIVVELQHWLRAHPLLFSSGFVLGAFVFYATCELLPKMIFRSYPNRLCLMLAGPFRIVHLSLKPLVAVVRWLATGLMHWSGGRIFTGNLFGNREELRRLMTESARGLTSEERGMIDRVLDLQTLRLGSVMVPIGKAISVNSDTPVKEAVAVCRECGLSRLPVWWKSGSEQRVI